MSKDITSEFTKTLGEQSGNARSHLDSVIVSSIQCRFFMVKQTNYMMSSPKI
jgi:hypothetical protein